MKEGGNGGTSEALWGQSRYLWGAMGPTLMGGRPSVLPPPPPPRSDRALRFAPQSRSSAAGNPGGGGEAEPGFEPGTFWGRSDPSRDSNPKPQ